MEKLQRDMLLVKAYAVFVTLLLGVFMVAGFRQSNQKTKFTEIDVERINVVEKDGKLKMTISNSERQHPGVIDGKTISRTEPRPPGIIFFNEKGDECGGLAFYGNQKDGAVNAGALLAFDRFRQDQTVGISYSEDNRESDAALLVWDRPETSLGEVIDKLQAIEKIPDGPAKIQAMQKVREMPGGWESGPQRVFLGRTRGKAAALTLSDPRGRPRLQLMVDAQGAAKLEFLDEKGNVVQRLPAESGGGEKK
jgi:hypothetical protein